MCDTPDGERTVRLDRDLSRLETESGGDLCDVDFDNVWYTTKDYYIASYPVQGSACSTRNPGWIMYPLPHSGVTENVMCFGNVENDRCTTEPVPIMIFSCNVNAAEPANYAFKFTAPTQGVCGRVCLSEKMPVVITGSGIQQLADRVPPSPDAPPLPPPPPPIPPIYAPPPGDFVTVSLPPIGQKLVQSVYGQWGSGRGSGNVTITRNMLNVTADVLFASSITQWSNNSIAFVFGPCTRNIAFSSSRLLSTVFEMKDCRLTTGVYVPAVYVFGGAAVPGGGTWTVTLRYINRMIGPDEVPTPVLYATQNWTALSRGCVATSGTVTCDAWLSDMSEPSDATATSYVQPPYHDGFVGVFSSYTQTWAGQLSGFPLYVRVNSGGIATLPNMQNDESCQLPNTGCGADVYVGARVFTTSARVMANAPLNVTFGWDVSTNVWNDCVSPCTSNKNPGIVGSIRDVMYMFVPTQTIESYEWASSRTGENAFASSTENSVALRARGCDVASATALMGVTHGGVVRVEINTSWYAQQKVTRGIAVRALIDGAVANETVLYTNTLNSGTFSNVTEWQVPKGILTVGFTNIVDENACTNYADVYFLLAVSIEVKPVKLQVTPTNMYRLQSAGACMRGDVAGLSLWT